MSSAWLQYCVVKTFQLQFEGLHGEQLNLYIVWFQLTSLRSPLLNGLINVFSMIISDKKQVQQKSNILANLILRLPSQNNLIIQNLSSHVKWNKFRSELELNGSLLKE